MNRYALGWMAAALMAFALICLGGCSKSSTVQQNPQNTNSGGSSTLTGKSLDAGKSTQCRSQLTQIRQAIEAYRTTNEQNPASLADLSLGVGEDFYKCPVSGQPYVYDANTGTVHCVNPQHANF